MTSAAAPQLAGFNPNSRLSIDEALAAELYPCNANRVVSCVLRTGALLLAGDLAGTLAGSLLGISSLRPVDLLLLAVPIVLVLGRSGLYRRRLNLSLLDDVPVLLLAYVVAGVTGIAADDFLPRDVAVGRFVRLATFAILGVAVVRGVAYSWARRTRCARRSTDRTLILGCGRLGARLAETFVRHSQYGLEPIGFLDDEPELTVYERPIPHLGRLDELGAAIERYGVTTVLVAFPECSERRTIDVLRAAEGFEVRVFAVPRLLELKRTARDTETVRGIPLVLLPRPPMRTFAWHYKRVVDLAVAAIGLLLLSPLLLACAVAVRLEMGPEILFRQERVGKSGQTFHILKFHTLKPATDIESATRWSVANDDRMGPVGRLLRRLSLDELPQLWNILVGDMTLVGPRPERPNFVKRFREEYPEYWHRHRVPCGLTGWAQ